MSSVKPVTGQAWDSEVFIAVRYYWLIVPICLWLLATLNLLITVYVTWSTDAPIWKSSLLAALNSQNHAAAAQTLDKMKQSAGREFVRLIPVERMWLLERDADGNR